MRSRPTGEESSEDEVYEVEAILDHKKRKGGGWEYQVKWEGYKELSWEPRVNLTNNLLLMEYVKALTNPLNY